MAIKILIDDRYRHRGSEYVSINPKLSRLLLYKKGYELIKKHHGKDVDYVQILTDDDRSEVFWLKPCDLDSPGMRKLDRTSENSRTLTIRALLAKLKWKPKTTVRLPLEWDKEQQAARIDVSQAKGKE
jgi:hypothetical protein